MNCFKRYRFEILNIVELIFEMQIEFYRKNA